MVEGLERYSKMSISSVSGSMYCSMSYWPNESLLPPNARYNNDSIRIASLLVHDIHSSLDDAVKACKKRATENELDRQIIVKIGSIAPIELNPPPRNVETFVRHTETHSDDATKVIEETRKKEGEAKALKRAIMARRQEIMSKRANDPLCELANLCASIGSRFKEVEDLVLRIREMAETRDDVALKFLSDHPHMTKTSLCSEIIEKYKELCSDAHIEPSLDAAETGVSVNGYECRLPTD